ncbi:MAG: exosome catalytic subunit dis3, partial [Paramarteilia canceri]
NIPFNYESGKALAKNIDYIDKNSPDHFSRLMKTLVTRSMMQARYFCASYLPESEQYHYGQGIKFYTHFTSPIRRYADIIVHRLLAAKVTNSGLKTELLTKRRYVH